MNDDAALLRRYVEEGSEPAFAALVRRYVDLVYGAAMRRTGSNAQLAADVSQAVFTALARQARRLAPDTVLGAWLHTATRNAAVKVMVSEQRRRVRETHAMIIGSAGGQENAAGPNWEELRRRRKGRISWRWPKRGRPRGCSGWVRRAECAP